MAVALLHRHGDRIFRVKGLVRTTAGANPIVIHGVQHSMHQPVHLVGEDDGQESFLVFITRGLQRAAIEGSLARFLENGRRLLESLTSDSQRGRRAGQNDVSPAVSKLAVRIDADDADGVAGKIADIGRRAICRNGNALRKGPHIDRVGNGSLAVLDPERYEPSAGVVVPGIRWRIITSLKHRHERDVSARADHETLR